MISNRPRDFECTVLWSFGQSPKLLPGQTPPLLSCQAADLLSGQTTDLIFGQTANLGWPDNKSDFWPDNKSDFWPDNRSDLNMLMMEISARSSCWTHPFPYICLQTKISFETNNRVN